MIDRSLYSHAWIRTNTKEAMDRTKVVAAVTLCFRTEPESRVTLWYAILSGDGPEFTTPTFSLDAADGSLKPTPCLSGKFSEDMIELAAAARERLKKELGHPGYGKLYKIGESVKEITK